MATAIDDVCARCGAVGPVKSVTYLFHDSTRTENMCEACKARLLVRTRVKAAPEPAPAPSLLKTAFYGTAAAVLLAIGAGGLGVHQPTRGAEGSVEQCAAFDAAAACVSPAG